MSKFNDKHSKIEGDISHQAISSYFLGPRAENFENLKSNILTILEEQRDSRLDYFPEDGVSISFIPFRTDSGERFDPSKTPVALGSTTGSCGFS